MLEPCSGEMPAMDVWPEKEGGEQSMGVPLPQDAQMAAGFGVDLALHFPVRQVQDSLLDGKIASSGIGGSYPDEDFMQQWGILGRKG